MQDNPFLIRELRQLTKRPRGVQSCMQLCLVFMFLAVCAGVYVLPQAQGPRLTQDEALYLSFAVLALRSSHTVLCVIAAGYGGYRIFMLEHSRFTFEPLQLLPYSPERWVWLKLTFPILATLVASAIGFPFYIVAAACGLIRIQSIVFFLQAPLLICAGLLLAYLLTTPELTETQR